jgi:hypothetical protein
MASGGESSPLVEHERRTGNVTFADESIEWGQESLLNQSISDSFNLHFPEFSRSFSIGSDQDSDFPRDCLVRKFISFFQLSIKGDNTVGGSKNL